MTASADPQRLPVGQLLVNLLRVFRADLAERGATLGDARGLRPVHLHLFGTIKADGSRLTELAAASGISLAAMAEVVDDLQALGYVERRPDPSDGRAKLVCLTDAGWRTVRAGRRIIRQIEADWGARVGHERFEQLCASLQALLDALDPGVRAGYAVPPPDPPARGT